MFQYNMILDCSQLSCSSRSFCQHLLNRFSWWSNPGSARLKAKAEQRLLLSLTQLYAPFESKSKLWGRANTDSGTAAASASDRLAVNLGAEPWRLRAQTAWIDNSFADRNRNRQALRLIIPPRFTLKNRQPSSDCRYHPQKSKQWGNFFFILFSQTTGLVIDKKNPKVFKIPLDLVPLIVTEMLKMGTWGIWKMQTY